jgi:hypothetical protein
LPKPIPVEAIDGRPNVVGGTQSNSGLVQLFSDISGVEMLTSTDEDRNQLRHPTPDPREGSPGSNLGSSPRKAWCYQLALYPTS